MMLGTQKGLINAECHIGSLTHVVVSPTHRSPVKLELVLTPSIQHKDLQVPLKRHF